MAVIVAGRLIAVSAATQTAPVFVRPPRSIADITAILDQQKPDKARIAALTNAANAPMPAGATR